MENMSIFGGSSPAPVPVSKFKDAIELYHGTDFGGLTADNVTAERDSSCVYEFGHGFYISPDIQVATEYAGFCNVRFTHEIKDIYDRPDLDDKERRKLLKLLRVQASNEGHMSEGHIYKFSVDMKTIHEANHLEEYDNTNILNHYIKVITNYETDKQFRPSHGFTYGPICGKTWDSLIKDAIDKDRASGTDIHVKEFFENIKRLIPFKFKQLCIHHNSVGGENVFKVYVKYEGRV